MVVTILAIGASLITLPILVISIAFGLTVSFKASVSFSFTTSVKLSELASMDLKISAGVQVQDARNPDDKNFDHSAKAIINASLGLKVGDAEGKLTSALAVDTTESKYDLSVDVQTPPVMIPFDPDQIYKLASSAAKYIKDSPENADLKNQLNAACKMPASQKKGFMSTIIAKGKNLFEGAKPYIDAVKALKAYADVYKPQLRNVLFGAKLSLSGSGGAISTKGELYIGAGKSIGDTDMTPLGGIKYTDATKLKVTIS